MSTDFPSQVMLCRWRKPRALLSVQVPWCVGLLDGLCNFLCAPVKFPAQIGCGLYSAISKAMNKIPCLNARRRGALTPVKLFVALTQADPHHRFPGQMRPLALQTITSACSFSSSCHWATQLPGVVSSPSGQTGLKSLSIVGKAVSQCPSWV